MALHFEREVDRLKKRILSLCARVEDAVHKAIGAVEERDTDLAAAVIEADRDIDRTEVEIEEECLKILALHQPVAIDLRFVVSVLKIADALEFIGDKAVNIAKRAKSLAEQPANHTSVDFARMAGKTEGMLRRSLDALVHVDSALARQVCADDDEVDAMRDEIFGRIKAAIRAHPQHVDRCLDLLAIARHLERIADLASNIAEDVIYMVDGEIVRHAT